jgi:hypothetical protein
MNALATATIRLSDQVGSDLKRGAIKQWPE